MTNRKQGSTYPMTGTLLNGGAAVNLTGSTVTMSMRDASTGALKISNVAVTVVSPAAGTWSYTPIPADVNTPGVYQIEMKEVRGDGSIWYYPSTGYEPLTIEATFP